MKGQTSSSKSPRMRKVVVMQSYDSVGNDPDPKYSLSDWEPPEEVAKAGSPLPEAKRLPKDGSSSKAYKIVSSMKADDFEGFPTKSVSANDVHNLLNYEIGVLDDNHQMVPVSDVNLQACDDEGW